MTTKEIREQAEQMLNRFNEQLRGFERENNVSVSIEGDEEGVLFIQTISIPPELKF